MGFCTPQEYLEFMREAPEFERMLVHSGLSLTKFWFSVSRLEAMRHILEKFDYPDKNPEVVGTPDRKIIGPPSLLSEKTAIQSFTRL